MIKEIFDTYGASILLAIFVLLFILEKKFQLRHRVSAWKQRTVINLLVSIPSLALFRLLLLPIMVWLSIKNREWEFGIAYWIDVPDYFHYVISFLLLDYFNYVWHILLHKINFLWRFHIVHHTDLDLDITTAFRFHFGEMITSIFFRGAAVIITGASPVIVLIYEIVFEAATQFHHSNLKIPFRVEKFLSWLIVTPRMHGIHHSIIKKETDSNFSIIFSFWDRIHRTVRLNILQNAITIGVPSYQNELSVGKLLKMPFGKIRPWTNLNRPSGDNKNEMKE